MIGGIHFVILFTYIAVDLGLVLPIIVSAQQEMFAC